MILLKLLKLKLKCIINNNWNYQPKRKTFQRAVFASQIEIDAPRSLGNDFSLAANVGQSLRIALISQVVHGQWHRTHRYSHLGHDNEPENARERRGLAHWGTTTSAVVRCGSDGLAWGSLLRMGDLFDTILNTRDWINMMYLLLLQISKMLINNWGCYFYWYFWLAHFKGKPCLQEGSIGLQEEELLNELWTLHLLNIKNELIFKVNQGKKTFSEFWNEN